jgi:hypothetical protein
MTALESAAIAQAKAAQAKLGEARELLLQPNPGSLEQCRSHFGEVAQILEELIAAGKPGLTPELVDSVRQIRQAAREFQTQMEHGSRFCLGWLHMRMGVGYTKDGVPLMLESMVGSMPGSGERRSFEL